MSEFAINKIDYYQLRMRFTKTAEEIIRYDCDAFECNTKTSFINRILWNYYESAQASIERRLEDYSLELSSLLPPTTPEDVINILMHKKREDLLNLLLSFENQEKGVSTSPIRLQNKIYDYFCKDNDYNEEKNYSSVNKYLITLIEEYARLPYVKRELIYFKETIDTIKIAIELHKQLVVLARNSETYYVIPYKIMTDPLSMANYLVGYSYQKGDTRKNSKICSFRISRICNVKIMYSKEASISKIDKQELESAIEQRGVMFLFASSADNIVVRLSDKGKTLLNTIIHMRPPILSIDNNVYTFSCSIKQAHNYFFNFGAEAEILSPASLREQVKEQFIDAVNIYT